MLTRVLIVDDHPLMCEALSEALTMAEDADFEVQATRTLADGLQRVELAARIGDDHRHVTAADLPEVLVV